MSDPSTNRKTAYHHGDLRRTLLSEAVKLLQQEGEAGLSMRRLAEKAQVSRTAAYHHFDNKQGLLCAIAVEGFDQLLSQSQHISDQNSLINEKLLNRFVTTYLTFAVNQTEYYDLMFGSSLWKSGITNQTLTARAHAFFSFYVTLLRSWQTQGAISKKIDPLRHAQVTFSTLHGMSRLLIDGIYVDTSTITAIGDHAAGMFWRELQQPTTLTENR